MRRRCRFTKALPSLHYCNSSVAALAQPAGSRVLVHDYTKRAHYAAMEEFLKLVGAAGSLAVFEVWGHEASRRAAVAALERYKFDPR
jgi:hypothetical protein